MNLTLELSFLWFDIFSTDDGQVYVLDSENERVLKKVGDNLKIVEDQDEVVEVLQAAIEEQIFLFRKN